MTLPDEVVFDKNSQEENMMSDTDIIIDDVNLNLNTINGSILKEN